MGMYDRVADSGVWVPGWIGLVEWSLRLGLPFHRERFGWGTLCIIKFGCCRSLGSLLLQVAHTLGRETFAVIGVHRFLCFPNQR